MEKLFGYEITDEKLDAIDNVAFMLIENYNFMPTMAVVAALEIVRNCKDDVDTRNIMWKYERLQENRIHNRLNAIRNKTYDIRTLPYAE